MKNTSLPSIKVLFSQAWMVFTKSIKNLFFLNLVNFLVALILGGIFMVILIVLALPVIGSISNIANDSTQLLKLLISPNILLMAMVFVIGMIVLSFIQQAFSIGSISIIDSYQSPKSLGDTLKKSFGLVIPLYLTSILYSLLVFGGFFLFIIPGMVIGIFLCFYTYEVVILNNRYKQALKNSVQTVNQYFGEIILRAFIFMIITMVITYIPNIMVRIDKSVGAIFQFIWIFVGMFLSWYGFAYWVTLYKQAKDATDTSKPANLTWMIIVAVVGWIIFALMGVMMFVAIQGGVLNKIYQAVNNANEVNNMQIQASPMLDWQMPDVPVIPETPDGAL